MTTTLYERMAQIDLRFYDIILVNTSAGKDSLAMLDYVCELAREAGVLDRVIAVHCDLGRVEWSGTRELAERQARRYGIRFEVVKREQNDLLDHVAARGKWPGNSTRYCTSDHKTKPVAVLMTSLVDEAIERLGLQRPGKGIASRPVRRVRILNCLGLRAQESPKRRDMQPVSEDPATNATRREVVRWLPIHGWRENEVWSLIRAKGLPYHRAYDLGMPRLSCVFCFYAPKAALLTAGYHNRGLLDAYVEVEQRIGHSFKYDKDTGPEPLVEIRAALDAGYVPGGAIDATAWSQCA